MGAPRTAAGHAAAKLKVALMSKLGGDNDEAVLRAANLCDRYLNSCNNTDGGLEVLKEEVKKILSGQDAQTLKRTKQQVKPVPLSRTNSRPNSKPAPPAQAKAGPASGPSSPEKPWTLPTIRRLGRAHISDTNPYNKITHHLATAEMTDDEIRHYNKAMRAKKTRDMLDGQMKEVQAQREADRQAQLRAKEESDQEIRHYWESEMQRRKDNSEKADRIRKQREAQVNDVQRRNMEAKKHLEMEAAVERAEQEEEKRREYMNKMATKRQQEEDLRRAAQDNKARLQAKAEERASEQEENKRLALLQIRMAEEADAKRVAGLDVMKEKIMAKYRAAGGEARELDLAAKAKADAAKAAREAAERERMIEADLRRREMDRKERTELQLRSLEDQLSRQKARQEKEIADKRQYGQELRAESAARKAKEKADKEQLKVQQRLETQRHLAEIEAESKRRFEEETEQMGRKELGIHRKVVLGTARPFHYFKAQDPST